MSCVICQWQGDQHGLHPLMKLCATQDCLTRFCDSCAKRKAAYHVDEACRVTARPPRCSGCDGAIPFSRWSHLDNDRARRFKAMAKATMSAHCSRCDRQTTFLPCALREGETPEPDVLAFLSRRRARRAVLRHVRGDRKAAQEVAKLFADYVAMLDAERKELRRDRDELTMSLLQTVVDPERRAALMVSLFRHFSPAARTACCNAKMCGVCHVDYHHYTALECQETRERTDADLAGVATARCPDCYVPFFKDGGCSILVCTLCGCDFNEEDALQLYGS